MLPFPLVSLWLFLFRISR